MARRLELKLFESVEGFGNTDLTTGLVLPGHIAEGRNEAGLIRTVYPTEQTRKDGYEIRKSGIVAPIHPSYLERVGYHVRNAMVGLAMLAAAACNTVSATPTGTYTSPSPVAIQTTAPSSSPSPTVFATASPSPTDSPSSSPIIIPPTPEPTPQPTIYLPTDRPATPVPTPRPTIPIVTPAPTVQPTVAPTPVPTPSLQNCANIPKIPFRINVSNPNPYTARAVALDPSQNKTATCQYDGILVNGEYIFINRIVDAMDAVGKSSPTYYSYIKNYVRSIVHDENITIGNDVNSTNNYRDTIYLSDSSIFYEYNYYGNPASLVMGGMYIRHEANWLQIDTQGPRTTNKNDLLKIMQNDIAFLNTRSSTPNVNRLVNDVNALIQGCQNGSYLFCKT